VGEVESTDPVGPSRVLESVKPAGAVSNSPDLHGIGLSFEAVDRLVAAIRFTAPVPPFLRPRGVPGLSIRCRSTGHFRGLGLPFKAHVTFSAEVLRGLGTPLMGFPSPSATSAGRSTGPGFHTRFVPPSGFPTLLTGCSLTCFPTSRVGTAHGVFGPPEPYPSAEPCVSRRLDPHAVFDIACSCSEDQEVTMPRSSRALLSAEIRTSGEPELATAVALMGFLPHRS
jgi:hypothetical protein